MLVEWANMTINLKYVTIIHRDYKNLRIDVYLQDSSSSWGHNCDTKKQLDDDYNELIRLIKSSANFKIDDEGHFLCSHCGAPN